jgi:hypothetical protein
MNIGDTFVLDGIRMTMTDSYHSSETSAAAGLLTKLENGSTITTPATPAFTPSVAATSWTAARPRGR